MAHPFGGSGRARLADPALRTRGRRGTLRHGGFQAPDLGQLFYRFLNPTNFYQVIGNPSLKPEHANSCQVGGEATVGRGRVRLGANVFRNDVNDLGAGFALPGAYSQLDAEDVTTGLALTNRNRHQGVARLAWESRRTGTRANLRCAFFSSWIAARSTSAGQTTDTVAPAFQLWDVYVAQRVRHGLEAFAAVRQPGG